MFKSLLLMAAAYAGYKCLEKYNTNNLNGTLKLTPRQLSDVNPAQVFRKPTPAHP